MPGKASDQDRPWDVNDEDANGENVGCREVAEDMTKKVVSVILVILFVRLLVAVI